MNISVKAANPWFSFTYSTKPISIMSYFFLQNYKHLLFQNILLKNKWFLIFIYRQTARKILFRLGVSSGKPNLGAVPFRPATHIT